MKDLMGVLAAERPTEQQLAVPTVLGVYADRDGDLWKLNELGWTYYGYFAVVRSEGLGPEEYVPLTRLEPANLTAKRVLDAVRDALSAQSTFGPGTLQRIGRQFGVDL